MISPKTAKVWSFDCDTRCIVNNINLLFLSHFHSGEVPGIAFGKPCHSCTKKRAGKRMKTDLPSKFHCSHIFLSWHPVLLVTTITTTLLFYYLVYALPHENGSIRKEGPASLFFHSTIFIEHFEHFEQNGWSSNQTGQTVCAQETYIPTETYNTLQG